MAVDAIGAGIGGYFFLAGVLNCGFPVFDNYAIYLFRDCPAPLFPKVICQNGMGIPDGGPGRPDHDVTYSGIGMSMPKGWIPSGTNKTTGKGYFRWGAKRGKEAGGSQEPPTVEELPPPGELDVPPYLLGKKKLEGGDSLKAVKEKIMAAGGPKPAPGAVDD